MPFAVACPKCKKSLRLRDELASKTIKCPGCSKKFVAKSESDEEESIPLEEENRPARQKKAPREKKRPREVEQAPTPTAPLIWGILAILCPLGPVGLAIAGLAVYKANAVLGELPVGRRGSRARLMMKIVIGLGLAGAVMDVLLMVGVFIANRQ